MIPTTTPPLTNRAVDSIVMTDRAVPDRDQTDRNAANTQPFQKDDPEPPNRRGRRHFEGEQRRARRSIHRAGLRAR